MASILDFGGVGDGTTDNTPALNAALAALESGGDRTLQIPAGEFAFKTVPDPILFGAHIVGQDIVGTVLTKQFNGGNFFNFTGAHGSGGGMHKLCIAAHPGYVPGNAILLSGINYAHPEFAAFDELYVTGEGNWNCCFEAYGNNIVLPQGIRGVRLNGVHLFNALAATLWLSNVVAFSMVGGGVYGAGSGCGIWVAGGGTPTTNSVGADFIAVRNNGVFNLTNCSQVSRLGGERGALQNDAASLTTFHETPVP